MYLVLTCIENYNIVEIKQVHIFDVSSQLASLDVATGSAGGGGSGVSASSSSSSSSSSKDPVFTYTGHAEEGFAMAWSPKKAGKKLLAYFGRYYFSF